MTCVESVESPYLSNPSSSFKKRHTSFQSICLSALASSTTTESKLIVDRVFIERVRNPLVFQVCTDLIYYDLIFTRSFLKNTYCIIKLSILLLAESSKFAAPRSSYSWTCVFISSLITFVDTHVFKIIIVNTYLASIFPLKLNRSRD